MIRLLLSLLAVTAVHASVSPEVQVAGCKYPQRSDEALTFDRFRKDVLALPMSELGLNPVKARNTSGMMLSFRTDSKTVTARFLVLSANYMGSGFGIFENGTLVEEFKFRPKDKEVVLKVESASAGRSVFEIALPSFADVEFRGLEIDQGAKLDPVPDRGKSVYVALGDSISHGVGQDGYGHKTWPFLLARKLDYELFNLAVGGAKVAVPVGAMLEDWDRIDLITILVGYNDLHFDGKTPEEYRKKYSELLDVIRKNHPETKIACITPLFTKKPVSEKNGINIQQFRDVLKQLVIERQSDDSKLLLIEGDSVSSLKNLRVDQPKDPVHLGIEGAALFADSVFQTLED